jgi:hypothetical protein
MAVTIMAARPPSDAIPETTTPALIQRAKHRLSGTVIDMFSSKMNEQTWAGS